MAKFELREIREASDGSKVRLFQDVHDASWFAGKAGDSRLEPIPMGSFCSAEAARHWADQTFPGGTWSQVGTPEFVSTR
ncbi:MAG: hypothetical protein ABI321_04970 [Polyangia bacterium]